MKTPTFFRVVTTALCLAGAVIAQTPPAAPPAAPADPAAAPASGIKFSGLVDGYYSFNFNHPASRNNNLRNFEVKANQFSLNMTKFTVEKDADPVGFKLDLGFGRAWEVFHATDPATTDVVRYIPQAYVTFKPKNAGGLQIDFGKFYTSAGAELTENNLTWNYGRGFLYTNGPYYHMGLRINKPLNDKFAVGLQVVNGWNNVEDNNTGKTLGFTTAFTPNKKFSWYNNYYVGPEKTDTNEGKRNFFDTVLNLNPTDKASFYANFDYGHESKVANGDVSWIAIGLSSRFQTTEKTALAVRYEHYNDRNGFITGQAQKLNSFTVTGEYKWVDGVLARLEYRRDWSDKPYFDRGNTLAIWKNQDTLTLGIVAYFGPTR